MDESKKCLEKSEMLTLELNYEKQSSLTKEQIIKDREITILEQQQRILELQIELIKRNKKDKQIEKKEITDKKEKLKQSNRKFTLSIAEKYELDEGWGFNPDTGELI